MHPREDAHFGLQRTQGLRIAMIRAHALGEHGGAVSFVLEVFEDDVEVDIGELTFAQLGHESRFGLVF